MKQKIENQNLVIILVVILGIVLVASAMTTLSQNKSVYDFEDGQIVNIDTNKFENNYVTIDTTGKISGQNSLKFTSTDCYCRMWFELPEVFTGNRLEFKVLSDTFGPMNNGMMIYTENQDMSAINQIMFSNGDTKLKVNYDHVLLDTWEADTVYHFIIDYNWYAHKFKVTVNSHESSWFDMDADNNGIKAILFINRTNTEHNTKTIYVDDIILG